MLKNCTKQKPAGINKVYHFFIIFLLPFFCISGYELKAQLIHKVLFLGNSYTYVNDLPQIIHDVALSAGDTLIFDSHAVGGYHLIDHSIDPASQNKIIAGGWDYVVLQGQSQEPIMASTDFYNGAGALYSMIKQYNPCAVTMPYMTWGRKNGDAANCPNHPIMCTYDGMDTTLRDCYVNLTKSLNGEVSPVSVVWRYIRQNYPGIELYQADESHPSMEGSYAAACCFYTMLFKKDPTLISFDSGLNATDAAIIRNAAKTQVFDSLQAWDFKKPPIAKIAYQIGPGVNEVIFHATGLGFNETYFWDFGDGDTSSVPYIIHSYSADGTYTVTLTTTNCDLQGLHTSFADTVIQFCSHTPTVYSSQPWLCYYDTLWTQPADSYQWFAYGLPIPETNQYLANYYQYGSSGFSVISTLNGCSELSELFVDSPQWSGYYFDAMGNPCIGDTVAFAVLHTNGFLSGLENILWFKNDTLLSLMTNEDTLLITTSGKYECKVIDPTSNCPLDTTNSIIEYNCGVTGIETIDQELSCTLSPNPTTETITLKFTKHPLRGMIEVYDAIGRLIKSVPASALTMKISVADLPGGLYYIRLKNYKRSPLKLIKL